MKLISTNRLYTLKADLLFTDFTVPVITAVEVVVEVTEFSTGTAGAQVFGELRCHFTAFAARTPHAQFLLLL